MGGPGFGSLRIHQSVRDVKSWTEPRTVACLVALDIAKRCRCFDSRRHKGTKKSIGSFLIRNRRSRNSRFPSSTYEGFENAMR
jgi:hypothetical protein